MKFSENEGRKKQKDPTKRPAKECPIVLEDKYSKVLIKSGQHSPTPSLASSASVTETSSISSIAQSSLSRLSELLSERDCQHWLSSGVEGSHHNNNEVETLDKHVSDLMAFTQDIKT